MAKDDTQQKKDEEINKREGVQKSKVKEEKTNDKLAEELQEKIEEFESKYKRALADYQNLEKRVREERQEWIRGANKELILHFLPVLDTLVLAHKHVKDQGLTLSMQQFLDVLKGEGVERIETQEKMFDPNTMECVDTREGEEGKVIEEVRAGYKMFEKVLRPAQVVVGKKIWEK